MAANDATLRLERLSRHYGKVRAVDELSLSVPENSFVTLLGPSGCGKSTTLSLIAGLERPDGGSIYVGSRDITRLPPNERRMAMVFQNYALYPHMSAYDNIAFGLKLQRRPRAEIRARVSAVAEMLDISHLMKRRPGQMSGGQQQRVALGRALVKEPTVFLLDEPFSNLDAGLRARMRSEVKRLHLRLNTTSVFVTHDQEEAMTLSDLVAVMDQGRVVQYGSPSEIYRRPRNVYVASFVGKPKMSILSGSVDRDSGDVGFIREGLRVLLGHGAAAANGSALLGVRAEDVRLVAPAGDGSRSFPATVQLVEPIGSDTFVELDVGGELLVARVPPETQVDVGERVAAEIDHARVHLFDPDTGERIGD